MEQTPPAPSITECLFRKFASQLGVLDYGEEKIVDEEGYRRLQELWREVGVGVVTIFGKTVDLSRIPFKVEDRTETLVEVILRAAGLKEIVEEWRGNYKGTLFYELLEKRREVEQHILAQLNAQLQKVLSMYIPEKILADLNTPFAKVGKYFAFNSKQGETFILSIPTVDFYFSASIDHTTFFVDMEKSVEKKVHIDLRKWNEKHGDLDPLLAYDVSYRQVGLVGLMERVKEEVVRKTTIQGGGAAPPVFPALNALLAANLADERDGMHAILHAEMSKALGHLANLIKVDYRRGRKILPTKNDDGGISLDAEVRYEPFIPTDKDLFSPKILTLTPPQLVFSLVWNISVGTSPLGVRISVLGEVKRKSSPPPASLKVKEFLLDKQGRVAKEAFVALGGKTAEQAATEALRSLREQISLAVSELQEALPLKGIIAAMRLLYGIFSVDSGEVLLARELEKLVKELSESIWGFPSSTYQSYFSEDVSGKKSLYLRVNHHPPNQQGWRYCAVRLYFSASVGILYGGVRCVLQLNPTVTVTAGEEGFSGAKRREAQVPLPVNRYIILLTEREEGDMEERARREFLSFMELVLRHVMGQTKDFVKGGS